MRPTENAEWIHQHKNMTGMEVHVTGVAYVFVALWTEDDDYFFFLPDQI